MEIAFYFAACLIVFISFFHSYLGERYILIRLFQKGSVPRFFGGVEFSMRAIRFAWHSATIAWLGFALILVQLANQNYTPEVIGFIIAVMFLIYFTLALIAFKGKFLLWLGFLSIGLSILYAITIQ